MTGDTTPAQQWWDPAAIQFDDLKRQCVFAAQLLWREFRDIFGHVARRVPGTDTFMVRPMRVALGGTQEVAVTNLDCEPLSGGQALPIEIPIHSEIFRARPDVEAIVHAHPLSLTALSTVGETVRPITQQAARFGRKVPLTFGDFIETTEQGLRLAEALGTSNAVIQKGHGAVVVGPSLPVAVGNMIYLEQAARQMLAASAIGRPDDISDSMFDNAMHKNTAGGTPVLLWRQLVWDSRRWLGDDE